MAALNLLRLGRPFSRGAFSRAFLAIDLNTQALYVEKVLSPHIPSFGRDIYADASFRRRVLDAVKAMFLREAGTMKELSHENIVPFVEVRMGEYPTIVMKYAGVTLGAVARNGTMSNSDIARFILDTTAALDYLHSNGIAHLDISPNNVFFDIDSGRYMLGDFSLATRVSAQADLTKVFGEIYAMARSAPPEALENKKLSKKSDIWMFGYCLLYALTGGRFEDTQKRPSEILESLGYDFEPLLAGTPHQSDEFLKEILRLTLAKDPKARITAAALHEKARAKYRKLSLDPVCKLLNEQLVKYNLAGVFGEVLERSTEPLDSYDGTSLNTGWQYLQAMLKMYPGIGLTHVFAARWFMAIHLQTGNVDVDENTTKNFDGALKAIVGFFPRPMAGFLMNRLYREVLLLSEDSKRRLPHFLERLNSYLAAYTQQDGFVVLARASVDTKTGEKVTSLESIINLTDYHGELVAINLDDYRSFRFDKAVPVRDIELRGQNYAVSAGNGTGLKSCYVILPHMSVAAVTYVERVDKETRGFGFYSTINGVFNRTFDVEFLFQALLKNRMLATEQKEQVKLDTANSHIGYVKTNAPLDESFFIFAGERILLGTEHDA